jgi:inositol-phosphate phosphatase / L-galactose 1-phosphate phosphatase / histidinol-phosphatase
VKVPDEFVTLGLRLTEISRPILRKYYRRKIDIIDKDDASPVTQADRECEAAMREAIAKEYPAHGIIGEEFGPDKPKAEFVWVLDPLDGTRSFVTGRPTFGTLISLAQSGQPILGIIDMPILSDTWLGATGHATRLNGAEIKARPCADMAGAYLTFSSPQMFKGADRAKFDTLVSRTKSVTFGGDCYQYGMVATGFIDLVVELGLGVYDFMALVPILAGAGAHIADWRGKPLTLSSGGDVVAASDRRLLDQALAILGG